MCDERQGNMPIIHLKSKENGELLSKGSKEQINFTYFQNYKDLISSNMVSVLEILRGKKRKKKKIIPSRNLDRWCLKIHLNLQVLSTESGIVGEAMVLNAEIAKPFRELFESNRDRMLLVFFFSFAYEIKKGVLNCF